MTDRFDVTNPEQVSALLHPLRRALMERFAEAPTTPSEAARKVGITASKAHYHVNILHKAGLLELVETKRVGNVTEKYFRAVAKSYHVRSTRDNAEALHQLVPLANRELQAMLKDLGRFMDLPDDDPVKGTVLFTLSNLRADAKNQPSYNEVVEQLHEKWERAKQQNPGALYRVVISLVPAPPDEPNSKE